MNARTTYSDLTGDAAALVDLALQLLGGTAPPETDVDAEPWFEPIPIDDVAAAHRDLTSALVHLGQVLVTPAGDGSGRRSGTKVGPRAADTALLASLAPWAQPRDWSDPLPESGTPAGCLVYAARLTRAAADLWNTHRCSTGGPRSPEASRMRHPSMLGAATREWRELVAAAGCVAQRIHALQPATAGASPSTPPAGAPRPTYPTPPSTRGAATGSRTPADRVDLTVARPGVRQSMDPIIAIQDRVDHLRRVSWILAESGTAPIPILANTAAIGVLLASATAEVHRLAARRDAARSTGPDGPPALIRADTAELLSRRWSDIARLVTDLRSAHPSTTAIQVERVDLARLLALATRSAHNGDTDHIPDGLWSALEVYCDVGNHLSLALGAAHDRGEVYVRGKALPAHALPRRSDLLEAKLADRPVPLPEAMLRHVVSAYAALDGAMARGRRRPPRNPHGDDHSPAA